MAIPICRQPGSPPTAKPGTYATEPMPVSIDDEIVVFVPDAKKALFSFSKHPLLSWLCSRLEADVEDLERITSSTLRPTPLIEAHALLTLRAGQIMDGLCKSGHSYDDAIQLYLEQENVLQGFRTSVMAHIDVEVTYLLRIMAADTMLLSVMPMSLDEMLGVHAGVRTVQDRCNALLEKRSLIKEISFAYKDITVDTILKLGVISQI